MTHLRSCNVSSETHRQYRPASHSGRRRLWWRATHTPTHGACTHHRPCDKKKGGGKKRSRGFESANRRWLTFGASGASDSSCGMGTWARSLPLGRELVEGPAWFLSSLPSTSSRDFLFFWGGASSSSATRFVFFDTVLTDLVPVAPVAPASPGLEGRSVTYRSNDVDAHCLCLPHHFARVWVAYLQPDDSG